VPGRLPQALRIHSTGLLGQHPGRTALDGHLGTEGAARAAVDVGATSQVDSGSRSDWTTTA
jgi:hypothetical protein